MKGRRRAETLRLGPAKCRHLVVIWTLDLGGVVESQCNVFDDPGNTGKVARARSHTVITQSNCWSKNSVIDLLRASLQSIPASPRTRMAYGFTRLTSVPAE